MTLNEIQKGPVLITGEGKLAYSVAVCLLRYGYPVTLCTNNKEEAVENIRIHNIDIKKNTGTGFSKTLLEVTEQLNSDLPYKIAIVITDEDITAKKSWIAKLEKAVPDLAVIAINTDSIALSMLQEESVNPARIIGANWAEPAHTTYFLEIIANRTSSLELAESLARVAKQYWGKDPYIIPDELGVRAKMMAAMAREAFYLIENGFASIEDIDRACRNDPGYYLPFAGNFRYIDLMGGATGYGRVMKDLNPELSTAATVPDFFIDSIGASEKLDNSPGRLYVYEEGEVERLEETFRKYSYQIRKIIDKYPFYFPGASQGKANGI